MARLAVPAADSIVRLHLLAEAKEFRRMLTTRTVVEGGIPVEQAIPPGDAMRDAIWAELSGPVDALAAGETYKIHRYQMLDDHPVTNHRAGGPNDWLEIGTDDRLTQSGSARGGRPANTIR